MNLGWASARECRLSARSYDAGRRNDPRNISPVPSLQNQPLILALRVAHPKRIVEPNSRRGLQSPGIVWIAAKARSPRRRVTI